MSSHCPADCGGLCAPSFAGRTSTMPPWRTVVLSLPRTAPADCGGPCALTSAVVVAPPSWEGRSPAASGRTVVQCGRARSKARHTGGKSCVLSPFCSAVTNHLPPCSVRVSSVPAPSASCCCPAACLCVPSSRLLLLSLSSALLPAVVQLPPSFAPSFALLLGSLVLLTTHCD